MLYDAPHVPVRILASEARTLGDVFLKRCAIVPERPAFFEKSRGDWHPTTWADWRRAALIVAAGLRGLGIEAGDRVAILGPTRGPWAIQDMAAQLIGCVTLGIYPKQSPEQIHYLLEHSGTRVVFVDGEGELESVLAGAEGLDSLELIVPWTDALAEACADRDPRILSPAALDGAPMAESDAEAVQAGLDPNDAAIFVYTSGTTGPPKCAMISHANILACLGADEQVDFYEDDVALSFLPMAHVAERVMSFYGRIVTGIGTAYASSVSAVLEELREVRPTVFGSVPRIFEKAYGKIHGELASKPPAIQKLFAWAERTARAFAQLDAAGKPVPLGLRLQHRLADRLVYRKIRDAFGGRVRAFLTGAAPTPIHILEFFWGAGLPIYEVYGMTEATVVTHINKPGQTRLGTVGRVIAPMEHRIAEDGEVLLRGAWVFRGYYRNEEATRAAIIDGWLHTGDVGTIDEDGYLRITDRKKHLIITAGGKNLAPANIEKAIKTADPVISHVHAHGDRRPYVSALVVPSPIETLDWGQARGLVTAEEVETRTQELLADPSSRSEALERAMAPVVAHPEFVARMRKAVAEGNGHLARVEQVRRFRILDRDFSQERGELTPTMKVRRKAVEEAYAGTFDRIYDEDGFALEP